MRYSCFSIACILLLCGMSLLIASFAQPSQSGPGAPLEGAVLAIVGLAGFGLVVLAIFSFVFMRKRQIYELTDDQITDAHIGIVSEHTEIVFPQGAKLVGMCHEHMHLASRVAAKFELPDSCRAEFMKNSIFLSGEDRLPHYGLGSTLGWWKRNQLKSRTDRVQHLQTNTYVECSVGSEDSRTVVYVSWA